MSEPRALDGVRVLDLSQHRAGPYCTKLLAGLGADVLKVEPPSGDPLRHEGPFAGGVASAERSLPFLWLNTGKRSVVLDLAEADDRAEVTRLALEADVLVESFAPGTLRELGLDHATLASRNPRLVTVSISSFGGDGPYRDYRATERELQALGGLMHMTGEAERPPLVCGPAMAQYTAGLHAFVATLVALMRRERDGIGDHAELSMHESVLENIENVITNFLHAGKVARRGGHAFAPWSLYPCADGWAAVIGGPFRRWARASAMFGEPRLADPKLAHVNGRLQNRAELDRLMQPWLDKTRAKDVFAIGQQHGLAFGYLASFAEVMAYAQHRSRGFFTSVEHPIAGAHEYADAPFKMSATPWQTRRAPLLGEHDAEFEARAPGAPPRPAATPASEAPLRGVRVVDLTHSWAGPHASRMLADFGAEVIRVEYPRRLCMFRGGKIEGRAYDRFPAWHHVNRNKLSLVLDLARDQDRRILTELVAHADVFLENARSGVMERLGFAYPDLRRIRPDLVAVSMSGFGRSGPHASFAGYGATFETLGGIQNLTAYAPNGKPQRVREMDVTNGIAAAGAILAALLYRRRTGHGQHIDLSQLESSSHALVGEHLLAQSSNGAVEVAPGNADPRLAPTGVYPAAGEDQWVTVTVRSEAEWAALCTAAGHPEWRVDPRFATNAARVQHRAELDEVLAVWTRTRTHRATMELLQRHGVAAAAVLDARELARDPHLRNRSYFLRTPGTDVEFIGVPFRLARGGGEIRRRGPDLGEDSEAIVCDLLKHARHDLEPLDEAALGTAFDPE